jgi:chromosome segregation ATPase
MNPIEHKNNGIIAEALLMAGSFYTPEGSVHRAIEYAVLKATEITADQAKRYGELHDRNNALKAERDGLNAKLAQEMSEYTKLRALNDELNDQALREKDVRCSMRGQLNHANEQLRRVTSQSIDQRNRLHAALSDNSVLRNEYAKLKRIVLSRSLVSDGKVVWEEDNGPAPASIVGRAPMWLDSIQTRLDALESAMHEIKPEFGL